MHVWHAHAGVKLIVQAELCVGKTASIYIGMHGGLGNVVMHVWHVHEWVMPAGTLSVHAVYRSGRSAT